MNSAQKIRKSSAFIYPWLIGCAVLGVVMILSSLYADTTTFISTVPQPSSSPVIQELSSSEYQTLVSDLKGLTFTKNPRVALERVYELSETDPRISRICHNLVHEIGHAAYEKYENFSEAIAFKDDTCGGGYLHGVIETHFIQVGPVEQIEITMKTLCEPSDASCFHGVGHGIMFFTGNDLPQSVKLCASFTSTLAQTHCAEGIFMENFTVDQKLHPSVYLKPYDIFYPCRDQVSPFDGACYFYASSYYLSLHPADYQGALHSCKNANDFELTCITGVGSRMIKQNIKKPAMVESQCAVLTDSKREACIDGMVSYYLVHYASRTKAQEMCTKLQTDNRKICLKGIENRQYLFPE